MAQVVDGSSQQDRTEQYVAETEDVQREDEAAISNDRRRHCELLTEGVGDVYQKSKRVWFVRWLVVGQVDKEVTAVPPTDVSARYES